MIKKYNNNNLDVRRDKFNDYRRYVRDKKVKLNRSDFRSVLKLFNKKLIEEMIFNNFEFRIPRLGILSLKKIKVETFKDGQINKKLPIDWVKTKQFKKTIYILNEHTDGHSYYFDFIPFKFKNNRYYKFKPSRSLNRYLAKILKNPDVYGTIDAYLKY